MPDLAPVFTSRERVGLTARGLAAEAFPLAMFTGGAVPNSQFIFASLVGLKAGDVLSGISLGVWVTASGTAPTAARVGIADSTGLMVARSADIGAAANWTQGLPIFACPYTVPADGGYYLMFLVNGTWGTTNGQVGRISLGSQVSGAKVGGTAAPQHVMQSGQTDLPTVGNSISLATAATLGWYMAAAL